VVADGAYAKKEFLKAGVGPGDDRRQAGLRKGRGPAELARGPSRRGGVARPPTYGEEVIDLAKRGGQRRGWSSDHLRAVRGGRWSSDTKTFPGDLASGPAA